MGGEDHFSLGDKSDIKENTLKIHYTSLVYVNISVNVTNS